MFDDMPKTRPIGQPIALSFGQRTHHGNLRTASQVKADQRVTITTLTGKVYELTTVDGELTLTRIA